MNLGNVKSHFWKWFKKHAETYYSLLQNNEKDIAYLLDEMNMHLRAYCKYLEAVVGRNTNTGNAIFIITANGRAKYFHRADKLVALAPALENWEIQSLDDPRPLDCMLDVFYPDVHLDVNRLWFEPMYGDRTLSKAHIIVYSEWYGTGDPNYFEMAIRTVLYNLLGERSAGLDLGHVRISNLSEAENKETLLRLEELPFFISNKVAANIEISADGELRLK